MKIVLDTNAFYAFMRISENDRVRKEEYQKMLSSNELVVPAMVAYEFFMKYEDNIRVIKDGAHFIKENFEYLYNYGGHLYLGIDEIDFLLQCSDEEVYDRVQIYKERRIDIEARYATLFLVCLLIQYSFSYFFEKEEKKGSGIINLFERFMLNVTVSVQKEFVEVLQNGYGIGKAKKNAKDAFNSLLLRWLSFWIAFLEFIESNPSSRLDEKKAFYEFLQKADKSSHLKRIGRHADHINKWIAKYDALDNQQASRGIHNVCKTVLEVKGLTKIQSDYIYWKLSSMGQQKQGGTPPKFRKNDVLDMIILTALNDSDTVLISFDENVREFITHINHKSGRYIDEVYS